MPRPLFPNLAGFIALLTAALLLLALPARAEIQKQRVGLFVSDVSAVNPADGSARIEGYIWFVGPPGFDAAVGVELLGRQTKLEPFVGTTLEDGSYYQVLRFAGTFAQEFDMSNFPFDRHGLRVPIEAASDTEHLQLVPDEEDSRVGDFVHLPAWRFEGLSFVTQDYRYDTRFGYRKSDPAFSRLSLVIDISRQRSALVIERFTGFAVAFVLSCLIYAVPATELSMRIGLSSGAIFASVGNRYGIESALGFDAAFSLVDQVTVLVFVALLTAIAVSLHVSRKGKEEGPAAAVRSNRRAAAVAIPVFSALLVSAFVAAMT